ncbi:hypothetical protein [Aureivirga sp. CE67]|uniref:hypothetical protein n=1 Tax=Aureivirga sp. CE67 TaxID=1788983 RepID=UPI0018CAFC72|nr:hypothetical protein [Aureivirga sp. CE67]
MYRNSFPKCEKEGAYNLVPFSYFISKGKIPSKCNSCENLLEGECIRDFKKTNSYLQLDYGFCGISGNTNPVLKNKVNDIEIFVPEKCSSCDYLANYAEGFYCKKNEEEHGDFKRGLDWGDWEPKGRIQSIGKGSVNHGVSIFTNKNILTQEIIELLENSEKIKAMKIYRKLNKIETIKEAKEDIELY